VGNSAWFTASNTSIARSLYAVSLSACQRRVTEVPAGLLLYDISSSGQVLLTREDARFAIVGETPGQPGERDLSWMDWSLNPDFTPDGTTMLFSEEAEAVGPQYAVCLRHMDGSPPIRLGEGTAMALSPDGKWALALNYASPEQLVLLPTGPGMRKTLANSGIEFYDVESTGFFPDGKKILFVGSEPGHSQRAYVEDIESGKATPVTPEGLNFARSKHLVSLDSTSTWCKERTEG
jgi:WD40-like Beta Propeller Repeat